MAKATNLPLADLIEDMTIYPRHTVDDLHVATLADALLSGAQLPPVVADRRTKRVTDGWHRIRAYRRVLGETATAPVDLRDYRNDEEMILDAIALNSTHGRRLDKMDQVRAVRLAERAGATIQAISVVLHIPEARVEKLRIRIAEAPRASTGTITGSNEVALKRPAFHMAGKTLTPEQASAHESMPGTSLVLVAIQLRLALESNLANPEDARLVSELRNLVPVVDSWLSQRSDRIAA